MTGVTHCRGSVFSRIVAGLLSLSLLALETQAKKLELVKKVGDLTVEMDMEKDPPAVGKNAVEVRIKDGQGKPVQEAKVYLNYYMPPMPRMAPMNFKVEAKRKKEAYPAVMNLIMAGPWIILVRITLGDKTSTAKFQIDAR